MNSNVSPGLPETLQRAGVATWLARAWAREIDQEWLMTLQTEPFNELLGDACAEIETPEDEQKWLETWAVDFCRIMIGPRSHAAPIQSVWSEGKIAGNISEQMNELASVIRPAVQHVQGIPDHFANQLQWFSQILARQHLAESTPEDESNVAACQDLAKLFLQRHLSWAHPMLRKAAGLAQTQFYQSMIEMTQSWLETEANIYQ